MTDTYSVNNDSPFVNYSKKVDDAVDCPTPVALVVGTCLLIFCIAIISMYINVAEPGSSKNFAVFTLVMLLGVGLFVVAPCFLFDFGGHREAAHKNM